MDIISLSVGYKNRESQILRNAINAAIDKNVLVFAAAGNTSNAPLAFPASIERVIPIYSFGYRGPSVFNCKASESDYICAPGESVLSAWPHHLLDKFSDADYNNLELTDGNVPASGTSQATAIAVGVASRVLEFARQYRALAPEDDGNSRRFTLDRNENYDLLRTPHGMKRVLKFLSTPMENSPGAFKLEPWIEMNVPDHLNDLQALDQAIERFADRLVDALHRR